jgi:hypothetical protein
LDDDRFHFCDAANDHPRSESIRTFPSEAPGPASCTI